MAIDEQNPVTRSHATPVDTNFTAGRQPGDTLLQFVQIESNRALAASFDDAPADEGPFYHGTKADVQVGDLLTAGGVSNYRADLKMNHIYFTALMSGAGLAAAMARGDHRGRVYEVEPTGPFENDPNVTNKKFPGNLTRSYRSVSPLKVIREVTAWAEQTPEEIDKWRKRLAANKGEIIN
jgi:rifampin ADP-ribosylating transferase